MNLFKTSLIILAVLILFSGLSLAQEERPEGWDETSHGSDTEPDYATIFPQNEVNTITITLSAENWQMMMENMTELYGEPGTMRGFPMGGGRPPEGFEPPAGMTPMGRPPMLGIEENPIWVTANIEFEGQQWTNVGIRFKGNSSLMGTWGGGSLKLPFKLDFDQFEEEYPEINNQKFYGFQELSFSSNWSDSSLLREKVTADIFRKAGVPSAQTAFYAVYMNYGEGPVYFGLYTAVEMIEDTVIETQFADDNGNVYKPEGTGATFAEGTFNEDDFEKETNEDEADYSDVIALFDALHAETRTTDPETWRANLESVFDADGFIRWLAVNTVVQNWDTYGRMEHNYYLYNDNGQITWIPWDNNMALSEGFGPMMGGVGNVLGNVLGGVPGGAQVTLDMESVSSDWPLIRYLMDDEVYHDRYLTYVEETANGAFEPAKMEATYRAMHELIKPYVVDEQEGYTNLSSDEAFESALTELIEHVNARYAAVQEFLAER